MLHGAMVVRWASLRSSPARDVRTSRFDLTGPIHPSGRRTAHGDRFAVSGVPSHQTRVFRCRFEGLKGSQFSSRVRSDRRSDAVRRLTCMMIQAHVTSDSSLLRATCENRWRPLRCQAALSRTEARAQYSKWPAFARLLRAHAISRARARLPATCGLRRAGSALHAVNRAAFALKSMACSGSAALSAVST